MQGNILTYSEESDEGIITGPGGSRYKFGKADWKENCPVISRVNVDFVVEGDRATEIYCTDTDKLKEVINKNEADKAAKLEKLEKQKQEIEKNALNNEFSGFYRSADKNLWKGVLAGLAHKFGHKILWYRIAPLFLMFWAMIREGKDNMSGGMTAAFSIGIAFTVFYFYAAKKWNEKETDSNAARAYASQTIKDNNEKLAASLNKTANIMGALAGRGPNGELLNTSRAADTRRENDQAKIGRNEDHRRYGSNMETSSTQVKHSSFKESAFKLTTPVAITGAVIGKIGEDSFEYYEKCDACGFVRTYSAKSEQRSSWQTTMGGTFYCPKCSHLQKVEIKTV